MPTIKVECDSCRGTGVYSGFAEPEGVAVVCLGCKGTGESSVTYREFTGRKRRRGIREVRRSGGSFIATGVGPRGESIPYEDFFAGRMPKENPEG